LSLIIEIAKKYFEAWNEKDYQKLSSTLSDDVQLFDWDQKCEGLKAVVNATQKIHENLPDIQIDVINLYNGGSIITAELVINLGDGGSLRVVDLLTFQSDKICRIDAFKQ
jgi:hypothetical protein